MSEFISGFAKALDDMLDYRQALGFSRQTHMSSLMSFDRYCTNHFPDAVVIDKKMVLGWITEQLEKSRANIGGKSTAVRLFGKYLSAIGQDAYVLPEGYATEARIFTPYIFTDAELAVLFHAIDNLPGGISDPTAPVVAPVLFRLIYTCGLRPNEGRELEHSNINFVTGEVFVTKTKRKKERLVVMSDDMLGLCKAYHERHKGILENSVFFFPRRDEKAYTAMQMERLFKKCWELASPNLEPVNRPNVRVYDLRHRFASSALNRWLDEGRDLYAMLPYLRAYMGHDTMSEAAYYIHILPENLTKCVGVDWDVLNSLIPEVTLWRE